MGARYIALCIININVLPNKTATEGLSLIQ